MRMLSFIAIPALLTLAASSASSDQEVFAHYNTTFRKTYWSQLYPNGVPSFIAASDSTRQRMAERLKACPLNTPMVRNEFPEQFQ
jgi:hypothetical protein